MHDEVESPELLRLPFKQKDAWEWAFRAGMLAAYFWAVSHFVSIDRYEHDTEHQDAQRAIILKQLEDINNTMARIDEKMKSDDRRDRQIEELDHRVRALEIPNVRPR